ncbi:NAD(P)-binding domain-containing protein [candidate division KSB1 bacterium]|nr:NAD(P)-binding domain-containing protein [candidate division KSB1 bacterium]NIR68506.1 NAD(P)-binding domain-containing protein [candidate division KSB1 bacterium]NIS22520.1 NAD(P)-binding domain-containing protein [candidate division KSB1 bacterium]NIT69364.1 NAD(P)-binding domain-containing protein [candidate division KSB1 bacterium]NIU23025.1 NAD(P)-binding domain-containing protein [candidate division KSB1 bacterium]
MGLIKEYTNWLHTQWPAGHVEKLPKVNEGGSTNVPGLYITGDLRGIPLLKFSSDRGARVVQSIVNDDAFKKEREKDTDEDVRDLVIIGAGVSGMAAALEARKAELSFEILEATEPFSTIVNFPKGKPIYTYPKEMVPAGDLQLKADVKEDLLGELRQQTLDACIKPRMARAERVARKGDHFEVVIRDGENLRARRVIIAIGRSGNHRKLNVPGEDLDKVYNRLFDPKDYCDKEVLVVGGGDSALETAIAIAQCGGRVILSYRRKEFSRPKPENIDCLKKLIDDPNADVAVETPVSERVNASSGGFLKEHRKPGSIKLLMATEVKQIDEKEVTLVDDQDNEHQIPNDVVFTMIGREPPLDFLHRSGIKIRGEMGTRNWLGFGLFVLFCFFLYNWKADGKINQWFQQNGWFPYNVPGWINSLGASLASMANDPSTFLGTMKISFAQPGFYYSVAYTLLIVIFGIRRIQRRKTPYIRTQTLTLTAFQVIPLFLLPYVVLPYLGHNGMFEAGLGKVVADGLFPEVGYGHGREYWRAFGLILAWPLFIWNVFTSQPLMWWLVISLVQTFVIIPLIIYFWGKGAYCGWICSCGALAETLGDTHREKMVHGAFWNRVNMAGQVILVIAMLMFVFRAISWIWPGSSLGVTIGEVYKGLLYEWEILGLQLNYKWVIDLFLAGVIGYGAYFWFSGRVWCRFLCPLAALMHIYARFSRFRILADKKKCISCNMCTASCHQGIDIMNFANKGLPMEDPECVRCSACVHVCPTGVLQFGQVDRANGDVIKIDKLGASPVLMREEASN